MAPSWAKVLRCKTDAIDDVAIHHPTMPLSSSTTNKQPLRPLFRSCLDSSDAVKGILNKCTSSSTTADTTVSRRLPKPTPRWPVEEANASRLSPGINNFPTLVELPPGHPSRRVVEIIFNSSWSSGSGDTASFHGEVEMLFRFDNPASKVIKFEEYRAMVQSSADRCSHPRCATDGNEMMRFHCRSSAIAGDEVYKVEVRRSLVGGRNAEGIRTFVGSREAHQCSGGEAGRGAMLLCRVIAGRVRGESEPYLAGDSVNLGKGELLVFDTRAILPCFLIIYKL